MSMRPNIAAHSARSYTTFSQDGITISLSSGFRRSSLASSAACSSSSLVSCPLVYELARRIYSTWLASNMVDKMASLQQ